MKTGECFFSQRKKDVRELLKKHYGYLVALWVIELFNSLELYMKKNQECHIFICDPNQIMSLISVSLFHVLVYSVYIKQSNVEEF